MYFEMNSFSLGTKCVDAEMILDVGPQTAAALSEEMERAKTIIWNGPLGVFEMSPFAGGTQTLAEAIAASDAFSIAGGGDTVAALNHAGVVEDFSYVSTAGGAFLEWLEGKKLPGVEALTEQEETGK